MATDIENPTPEDLLLPAESISLTVALAQIRRAEAPSPSVATMCTYALARITGRYDWTADKDVS